MTAPRLYRVILPVDDIDKATAFYDELLGLGGERVSPGRHYFHTGECILALVDPRADGDEGPARPNADHVYLAVPDLEAVHRRAQVLGGLSARMGKIETRPWGERSFYMTDPFGNPLCFVDERTVFTGHTSSAGAPGQGSDATPGRMVIVTYRPRPGKLDLLMQAVKDHLTVLRAQSLATDRPALVLRAADGTILEIFEWKSREAIERAHANQAVQALWARFAEACEFASLASLEEAKAMFPEFEPVDLR